MPSPVRVFCKDVFSESVSYHSKETVFVVPSSSGRRRVAVELLNHSDSAIIMPKLSGIGELPGLLLEKPDRDLASISVQQVAWTNALIGSGQYRFSSLYKLSKVLQRDYADIMMWGYTPSTFPEPHKLVLECFDGYLAHLEEQAFADPYCYFQQKKFPSNTKLQVVLVGVLELPQLTKELLIESGAEVVSLVEDSEDASLLYDELGCIVAGSDQSNGLSPDQISAFDGVTACYDNLLSYLSTSKKKFLVCNLDESDSSLLQYRLGSHGINLRAAEGENYRSSDVARFISALGSFVSSGTYRDYSRLARFFDVSLEEVDRLFEEKRPHVAYSVHPLIEEVVVQLKSSAFLEEHIRRFKSLGSYLDRLDPDAVVALLDILDGFSEVRFSVPLSITEFVDLLVDELSQRSRPLPVLDNQVDLVGWLELRSYQVDEIIVIGGAQVSSDGDSLIKDSTRERLGLFCDRSRLQRDIAICRGLSKKLKFFLSRRNVSGEPVSLSQMLLAGDKEFRLQALSAGTSDAVFEREEASFQLRAEGVSLSQMRITSFATFWRSPYQFFLENVKKLREVDLEGVELSSAQLGSIVHKLAEPMVEGKDPVVELEQIFESEYSEGDSQAVALQFMMLRERIKAMMDWHKARVAEGWVVEKTEFRLDGKLSSLDVVGRIDRLDKQGSSYEIIDYKFLTSSDKYFRRNYELPLDDDICPDFQAALYLYFFREQLGTDNLSFKYVVISESDVKVVEGPGWDYVEAVVPIAENIASRVSKGDFTDESETLPYPLLYGRLVP